jgi:hypothetical protein
MRHSGKLHDRAMRLIRLVQVRGVATRCATERNRAATEVAKDYGWGLELFSLERLYVIDAWRARLDRMKLLQDLAGVGFERLREEFLQCIATPERRSTAKVYCCIAARPAAAA